MGENSIVFSDEELRTLTIYRRWFLLTFFVIIPLLYIILWFVGNYYHLELLIALLSFVGIFVPLFVFIYCLSKYNEFARKTAYEIIAKHFSQAEYDLGFKNGVTFEDICKIFGLLPRSGYIKWHNRLHGEKDKKIFSLADISFMTIRGRTGHATSAQYTVLTLLQKSTGTCEILIRKSKMFKWGVKGLKRLKLGHKEFEKIYDVYTNEPKTALSLLNPVFLQALISYGQISKKQPELIITPKQIFVFYNTGIWKKLFSFVIFLSARKQCEKVLKEINNVLDIMPTISLLTNQLKS